MQNFFVFGEQIKVYGLIEFNYGLRYLAELYLLNPEIKVPRIFSDFIGNIVLALYSPILFTYKIFKQPYSLNHISRSSKFCIL